MQKLMMTGYIVIYSLSCGLFSGYVAGEKGRSTLNWLALGVIFGVIALLAIIAVPSVQSEGQPSVARNQRGIRNLMLLAFGIFTIALVLTSI